MLLKKKPPFLFTIGAAVLLIGGGAIAYLSLSRQVFQRDALPVGVNLVPQAALMTLTLTTQESQWTKLRQFGTPETQQAFDNLLIEWRDRTLTANGYQFKQDIRPWIGEQMTLAFLPATDPAGQDAAATEAVIILPIADPLKAQALMATPKSASVRWSGRDYKGVNIQTITTTTGETFETTVLGTDWLVIAKAKRTIEQIIDIHKGAPSVVETAGYRQAVRQVNTPQAFAQLYINLPAAGTTLGTPEQMPLPESQGIAAAMILESEGLHFQGTSWLTADSQQSYGDLKNGADQMPRRLPDETLLMISGGSLKQLWQSLSQSSTGSFLPFRPENLQAGLQAATGLDFEEDLLPWMDGEFAFGLLPPKSQTASEQTPATLETGQLVLLVQASDRKAAETTWEQLDEVLKTRYRFQVKPTEIADESGKLTVTQWISPFQGITMSHGWLDGNVTFLGVGTGVADAIAPRPQPSLAETALFQALTAQAPEKNNGHFFIDLQKINALQGSLPIPDFSQNSEAITSTIEALTVTAAIENDHSILYDLSLKLAKGSRARVLPESQPVEPKDAAPEQSAPEADPQ